MKGGETFQTNKFQDQTMSPGSNMYNAEELKCWHEMRFKDQQPDRRSYHSTFVFDRKLYVYGGLDIREGSLNSLYELNLSCLNELEDDEGDG